MVSRWLPIRSANRSMLMPVVDIRQMGMVVLHRLMHMRMRMFARKAVFMHMVMMQVVVPVLMIVLHIRVQMPVPMLFA